MIVAAPTRRRGRRVNLTPLVDVIFLLVIFFLTSSTFLTTGKLKLSDQPRPDAEAAGATPDTAKEPAGAPSPILVAPIDAERVRINGVEHPYGRLIAVLDDLAAKGAEGVIVAPAASATLQDLATTIELARRSRIAAVSIRVD